MNYIYNLAQLRMQLKTTFSIVVTNESKPFISHSDELGDIGILFQAVDALPELPPIGEWHEEKYYTSMNGHETVYVRNFNTEPPYAALEFTSNGIVCSYLCESESYLRDTNGILNLIGLEKILLDNRGFLLHSSFIRYQGKGILFSAPCGTGKSTQANLWETYRNSDTLNGDRAGVRCVDGAWTAFGMPFAGTSGIYRNESAPMTAIVTLAQGPENVIRRLRPMEAVRKLLPECSCRRWDSNFMNAILDLLLRLVQEIPVYLLECRPDEGSVNLLHDTLVKDGLL